jgi:hypothetical protein
LAMIYHSARRKSGISSGVTTLFHERQKRSLLSLTMDKPVARHTKSLFLIWESPDKGGVA